MCILVSMILAGLIAIIWTAYGRALPEVLYPLFTVFITGSILISNPRGGNQNRPDVQFWSTFWFSILLLVPHLFTGQNPMRFVPIYVTIARMMAASKLREGPDLLVDLTNNWIDNGGNAV